MAYKTKTITSRGTGFPDFTSNIRNLDSEDVAHESLPYNSETVNAYDRTAENIAYQANSEYKFRAGPDPSGPYTVGWGKGKTFYLEKIEFAILDNEDIMPDAKSGFRILITVYPRIGASSSERIFHKTYANPNYVAVKQGGAIYYVAGTIELKHRHLITPEQEVHVQIDNYSAVGSSWTAVYCMLNGIAIS